MMFKCQCCGNDFDESTQIEVLQDILREAENQRTCPACWTLKMNKIDSEEHPEIPPGMYCYTYLNEEIKVCPHWEKKDFGARCNLLGLNSHEYDPFNLVWDQCKECHFNDDPEDI